MHTMTKREARDGTWEAHQPKSWSSNTFDNVGAGLGERWRPGSRGRPPSAHVMFARNRSNQGRLASEQVGAWTGFKPMVRPRPASQTTIMLQNPCIREGIISSDPIGLHEGVPANRLAVLQTLRRPNTAPLCLDPRRTHRTSDAIGTHPPPKRVDPNDAAAMHYEAQFARAFGDVGREVGAVLASSDTAAAVRFQQEAIARAYELTDPATKIAQRNTLLRSDSKRADGQSMEKMDFDAVYSNEFVNKDTESAIGVGLVPVIDPRCRLTRPKELGYGLDHRIPTASGARPVLPSRSFMRIGDGPGRAIDF